MRKRRKSDGDGFSKKALLYIIAGLVLFLFIWKMPPKTVEVVEEIPAPSIK